MLRRWLTSLTSAQSINEEIKRAITARDLDSVVIKHRSVLNQIHCATVLRHMGRNKITSQQALNNVLNVVSNPSIQFSSRYLSNCIYGIAAGNLMPNIPKPLVDRLVASKHEELNPQDLANTLWAFANRSQRTEPALTLLRNAILQPNKLAIFNAQDLANTSWALAKLNLSIDLEVLQREICQTKRINSFKPQELVNIVWAFATISSTELGPKLCRFFIPAINSLIREFKPQELVNVVWAFARCGVHECNETFTQELVVTRPTLLGFNAQGMSNLCWSFAVLKVNQASIWNRLAHEIATHKPAFTPQAVATIVWAFSQLQQHVYAPSSAFWSHMKQQAYAATHVSCSNKDCCAMLWSFAKAHVFPPHKLLEVTLSRDFATFTQTDLSTLLTALAILNLGSVEVLERIAKHINFNHTDSKSIISTLWAFACMDQLAMLAKHSFSQFPIDKTNKQEAWQALQLGICAKQLDNVPIVDYILGTDNWAENLVQHDNEQNPSRAQEQVYKLACEELAPKNVTVLHEARVLGGITVDIFLPERNLIIEVNGPHHFLDNGSVRGETVFKLRMLTRAGYTVHSLKLRDHFTLEDKHEWIKRLIIT